MQTIEIYVKNYDKETPELEKEFKKLGLQAFDSLGFQFKQIPEGVYHVETKHIFNNQYNTAEGYRIFEKCTALRGQHHDRKAEGYYISDGIGKIREYQKRVSVCHYCGAQYIDSTIEWCEKCRGSEYLEPDNYHLLKLTNVMKKYAPKDTAIPKNVLNDIESQQAATNKRKAEEYISRKLKELENKKAAIEKEAEFIRYCVKNGVSIKNMIYYNHTGKFCFGWHDKLTEQQAKDIWRKLKGRTGCPYDVEFKTI